MARSSLLSVEAHKIRPSGRGERCRVGTSPVVGSNDLLVVALFADQRQATRGRHDDVLAVGHRLRLADTQDAVLCQWCVADLTRSARPLPVQTLPERSPLRAVQDQVLSAVGVVQAWTVSSVLLRE